MMLLENPKLMCQAFNGFVQIMMPTLLPKMLETFKNAVKNNVKDTQFHPLGSSSMPFNAPQIHQ